MTERLYYTDSHLREFEARVLAVTSRAGASMVTLDRTAFYPTGGGQPSDTGTLSNARVVECIDDDGAVRHVMEGPAPEVGAIVTGSVDWDRRLDHIQQHTGQHLLSQSFIELFGAETRGFRMLDAVSEIDIALNDPSDARITDAVELANRVIWEDRPIRVRQVSQEDATVLSLRKEPLREGELRLIEIEGFDLTPCGGTHADRTGEVGLLAVRSWERAKGLTRVEFVAGRRALEDYNRSNRTARDVASLFSVGRDDAAASVARLVEENKQLSRRVRALEEITARVEAEDLVTETARNADGVRVIATILEDRDAESLRRLASALVTHAKTIALLGSREGEEARVVFARSNDTSVDMNALMREACAMLDGRGGGRADMAQGGGHNGANLESAIDGATRKLHDL